MTGKINFTILAALLLLAFALYLPVPAQAAGTIILNSSNASSGDTVTASGTFASDTWIAVKVVDAAGNIIFFDEVRSGPSGAYTCSFRVPSVPAGTLNVVAGYGSNVAIADLNINQSEPANVSSGDGGDASNDGGGTSTAQPVNSTTGSARVSPSAGGTVGLGSDTSVQIPAGALQGTSRVEVTVQEDETPPEEPSGFMVQGNVYDFTVNGQEHYNFNDPVTLTFTFDPSTLAPGEEPSVYYYDEETGQWIDIGGKISGNTITVTVDHFTKYAVMTKQSSTPAPKVTLKDISGHWAASNINKLVAAGAISGYPNGTFKPDKVITRAEFTSVLVRAFNLKQRDGKVFADTNGHWAQSDIATAVGHGLVSGYTDTKFGPDNPLTREQMAAIIVRAAKLGTVSGKPDFKDSDKISGWAKTVVNTAVEEGIMSGYPEDTFRPQRNATRAEAVTVIVKALE